MEELGLKACKSITDVVENSKYIFLSVKPNIYKTVLETIKNHIMDDAVIITMAAGISINDVQMIIGDRKIVRTMPNTPALVGSGFTAVCLNEKINECDKIDVLKMISSFGEYTVIDEKYISAYSAITGSGPAYIFVLIEAMADAAVMLGIPRKEAYKAVESVVMGSANLALKTELHPGLLKDMVCSPGGTTIEGVRTLEEKGLRSGIIEAIINTYKKNNDINNIR
jgi:pyrroline-5-carboxylate reductase